MADEEFDSKNYVWVPDDNEVFIKGYIKDYLDDDTCKVCYKKDNKEIIKEMPIHSLDNCNPSKFNKCNDMAELTHLNEPSVIYNLNLRYNDDLIYTYSGLFLVAINPYKNLSIYNKNNLDFDKPHIYSIANSTYENLMKNRKDQSILVTGESGAGKTENTKKIIQYFSISGAGANSSSLKGSNHENIDEKILQANPIMESFGNAKTIKNNNSSRFGKFIKIYFDDKGNLNGANINYYLLEKSRVIEQLNNERNYHIFYQFLAGHDELSKFHLLEDYSNYRYLNDVEIYSDKQDFHNLINSFKIIGLKDSEIEDIFNILSIILHLGNIKFTSEKSDYANFHKDSPIEQIVELLNVERSVFEKNLLKPKVKAGREFIEKAKRPSEVKYLIDSLAKFLYENLFNYIIEKINKTLNGKEISGNFIGVLDIAGFEIFEINSFEQLCINYTNEKLQQFFNHHSFILEQSEYLREDIKWDYIDFGQDLQPTIELIENTKNPMGIMKCLDEECIMPKSTDKTFLDRLLDNFDNKKVPDNNHKKFKANKFKNGFMINHYAGEVEYNVDNWLSKNNDPISENLLTILSSSKNKFISKEMMKLIPMKNKSLSIKYKQQLKDLMEELNNTEPHFVRCILPNLNKKPNNFDKSLVLNQLRCNGVLEGIRITRAGYPNKMIFQDFFNRYSILNSKGSFTKDAKMNCEIILKFIDLDAESFKVGITKIFFKNGILGKLEELRDISIKTIFTKFQSDVRGQLSRKYLNNQINKIQNSQILAKNFVKIKDLKTNPWYKLFINMKPLLEDSIKVLNSKEINDNLKQLTLKLKDSEKLNKNYEKANEKLTKEIEEFNEKIKKNLSLIEEKDELITGLKSTETEISKKVEKLNKVVRALESKNASIETEKAKVEENLESLESKFKDLKTTHDKLADEFDSVKNNYEKSKGFDEKYDLEKTNHSKSIELLKAQKEKYDQLKNDHKTLKSNYEEINKANSSLESTHTKLNERFETLQDKYDSLKKELEALNRSNNDLNKSVKEFKSSSSNLKAEISKLNTSLNKLKVENEEMLEKLNLSNKELIHLKKENSNSVSQLKLMEQYKAEVDQLKDELRLSKTNDNKQSDLINSLNLQITKLKKDNSDLELKISRMTSSIESNEKSKQEYSNKILDLSSTINKLTAELKELRDMKELKENQPPSQEFLNEYSSMKLKLNELSANLRSEKFENSKLQEEVNILKNKIHISPYSSPTKGKQFRNSMQLGEDLSIMKGNNILIKQIDDLKIKLEQEEINSTRAENYAIDLQKKLNKLQNTRGINSSIDFEKKYKQSQMRISELENKFEKLFASSPRSEISGNSEGLRANYNGMTKSESFGGSVINKTLESANQDFVKIYHDITKTLKSTREELTASKSEILRLKSLLRDSEDEIYEIKRKSHKVSIENYENELASLKVKQDNLIDRNEDLNKSVKLYKDRSEEYFKKLELAESAIKISKRHEEQSLKELNDIKNEYKLIKEELKASEIIIKEFNNEKAKLLDEIKDKEYEIFNKMEKINELNDKINYNKKIYENKELTENYKNEIKNLHDELSFKLENESKLVKENKKLTIDNETLMKQKSMLEEDYEIKLEKMAELEIQVDDLTDNKRVLENEKAINERKLINNAKQIQNLKELINDITLQRDDLLTVKENLEEENLILNQTIEEKNLKISSNESNLTLLRSHLDSQRLQSDEIQQELNQSKLSTNDDITNYQSLKRENLVISEENDSIKKINHELKEKLAKLEDKLYNNEQIKYWENKLKELNNKLDNSNNENFKLNKSIYNYENEIKKLKIHHENDEKLIKQYNDENFNYKNKINHYKSNLDVLHGENLQKDLRIKTLERDQIDIKNGMLMLEKEVLQLRARLGIA